MEKLEKMAANYVPLTPISFLKRAASFYGSRTSVIYGEHTRFSWCETYNRCLRVATSLRTILGIRKNDVVSVLAPNIPALYEMHFAIPMSGAVLNAINTRLDPKTVKTMLAHSSAKLFFVDFQLISLATEALRLLSLDTSHRNPLPIVIVIDDVDSPTGLRFDNSLHEYEQLIHHHTASSSSSEVLDTVDQINEWDPITLNYTSGTTSAPKGVVYSHRGAYLSTLSLIVGWEMGTEPVYLWTLPMFHCNGWTFTWGVAARGGTNVCIRTTTASEIYGSIERYGVTHMCCAPIVFNLLLEDQKRPPAMDISQNKPKVEILTGGAPPPPALLAKIEQLGFHVVHAYGLTEATGPALVCEWKKEWSALPTNDQAKLKARQGISIVTMADVDVKDPTTLSSVPRDGKTIGEIVLRGSGIMKGYFQDSDATHQAFKKGWLWTGDMGVVHEDGYLEIKDRSKDVIISGGENISSVEVESVLFSHPAVLEVAVVAMPHPKWGESPCAFVVVKELVGEDEIVTYCRSRMPHYMLPKKVVVLEELPKTSTGKVQKGKLREIAKTFNRVMKVTNDAVIASNSVSVVKKSSNVIICSGRGGDVISRL